MKPKFSAEPDVTISDPNGATPNQGYEFKPLNVARYMRTANRKTAVEDAPSLIGGKHVPPPGVQP